MKSKNILLAGLAVSALAAASGAHALSLSGTSIGVTAGPPPANQAVTVASGSGSTYAITPYYIASEATIPGAGLTGTATLDAKLTTGNITSGTFLVTYSITGASFNTTSITNGNITYGGTPQTTSATVSTLAASSVSFLVTVSGASPSITDFIMNAPIVITAAGPVAVTASVTSGGVTVDNGSASGTIINFTPGYVSTLGTPSSATNQVASIASNFKLFKANALVPASTTVCGGASGDCTTASIGTLTSTTAATPTGGVGIYKSLQGSLAAVAPGDVTGTTVTASGNLGSTETLSIGGTSVTPGVTVGVGATGSVQLTQAAATAAARTQLAQSTYSLVATPVLSAAGLAGSGAATATLSLGKVTYEGVNLNAAWVGDGSNGFDFRIRIGNTGGAISGAVQVTLLDPLNTGTSGTVFSTAPCTIQTGIAAGAEVAISSAMLKTCFGAFGRSDLLVTVQGSSTNLTAKMRIINGTTGVVNEQTLGFGITPAQLP